MQAAAQLAILGLALVIVPAQAFAMGGGGGSGAGAGGWCHAAGAGRDGWTGFIGGPNMRLSQQGYRNWPNYPTTALPPAAYRSPANSAR